MAVMAGVFNETQRRTLEALCDTFVAGAGGRRRATRRCATSWPARRADMAIAAQIEGLMAQAMMPEEIEALRPAARRARRARLRRASRSRSAPQLLHAGRAPPAPRRSSACASCSDLTFLFFYALPDEQGQQPELGGDRLSRARSRRPPSPEQAPKTIARRAASAATTATLRPTSASSARAPAAA